MDVVGLQAQILDAAALGLRVRSVGLRKAEVARSLTAERSIVRTWLMRGTLHLVAADDLRWLLSVLGPVFAAGNKTRHAQLGLDGELKARGVRAIRRILSNHGPLTRYELVEALARARIRLDPTTQAPIHLIAFAAFNGVCCLGPDRSNGASTYVLLDDWVKAGPGPTRPLAELARRYFSAFGPASVEDLAAWSGLPMGQARAALSQAVRGLEQVKFRGAALFLPAGRLRRWKAPPTTRQEVRLLPAFDTYLLGYRTRDLAVERPLQQRLHRGGGWLRSCVVVDGRGVAAWGLQRTGGRARISIEPYEGLGPATRSGIEAEARDIGRFLGVEIALDVREPAIGPAPRGRLRQ